ncbi:hypothetical protein HMPREF1051_2287 [Neisseria sicca VK64]|uniref:Uncharacterized protein n=1 Tax=Neisseria sicca VK64 TaxID=1095748 RepID=I2NKU9_NEISI|nr:hypothetical protein HMPREF1051_2287 [Neisseria sicca VK64]
MSGTIARSFKYSFHLKNQKRSSENFQTTFCYCGDEYKQLWNQLWKRHLPP